jgi:hypothetical protein
LKEHKIASRLMFHAATLTDLNYLAKLANLWLCDNKVQNVKAESNH